MPIFYYLKTINKLIEKVLTPPLFYQDMKVENFSDIELQYNFWSKQKYFQFIAFNYMA